LLPKGRDGNVAALFRHGGTSTAVALSTVAARLWVIMAVDDAEVGARMNR
jgi:hypothetical protein